MVLFFSAAISLSVCTRICQRGGLAADRLGLAGRRPLHPPRQLEIALLLYRSPLMRIRAVSPFDRTNQLKKTDNSAIGLTLLDC